MYKLTYHSPRGIITFLHQQSVLYRVVLPGQEFLEGFSFEDFEEKDFPDLKKQVREYFEGENISFEVSLSFSNLPVFTREVLLRVLEIPRGKVVSYKELSLRLKGKSTYSRAVGVALKKNPLPLVVPCHRVVRGDGRIGDFSGGIELKRWLLELERHEF